MWLSYFFTSTKDNESKDRINEDNVNDESINISSKQEEKPDINDLKNRVEKVKMIHDKLQALQNKQDLNLNNTNTTNTLQDQDLQCVSTNKDDQKLEINNCKIEDVLKIIPVIENNLQSLTEKVSCLSDLFNTKQLDTTIGTEQNIISNNSNINSASNSLNKLKGVVNETTTTIQDTTPGEISKENSETRKHNRSLIIKKKYRYQNVKIRRNTTKIINKDDQKEEVMNEENELWYGAKSIDQLTNLNGQLESFYTKIQSALSQHKIEQVKEKSEIMFNLSRLEDQINMNYSKMDKLMSNVEQLNKINDPVNHGIWKNHTNLEIQNKHELQKSVDDIKICIDYLIKPNPVGILKNQQSVTDTPITNTNINGSCNSNRCVCKLIDNTNTASTQIKNSNDDKNRTKCGDIILCEFLKAKPTLENSKRDKHQQIAQVNHCSNQIDSNKNSHLLCSKQSNLSSNICDGNQIYNQKSSQSSVCSKKSNHLKKNGRRPEKPKINHLTVCPKQSIHHFFKNDVEIYPTSNQQNTKTSFREKNKICDFLSSQPVPEWIKLDENLVKSENLCCKGSAKSSPSNCTLNVSKFYNIERIINNSHDKNDIVYEITQKPDVPKENNNDCNFDEQNLAPCNSLNNEPWNMK